MTVVLFVISFGLAIWICLEKQKNKTLKRELTYISDKLSNIIEEDTMETVKLMTQEEEVMRLLVLLNRILEDKHKSIVNYHKSEESMKKMLSNISHDLKTPLTVILGYLEMLLIKYEEEDAVEKAYLRTQEVIKLLNQFFDLAKLESGDKEFNMEKIDLSELCRLSVLDFYNNIIELGAETQISIPEHPIYVWGNRDAIMRVLNNLLSNAMKYGMDGNFFGLILHENEQMALVQMIDHGKGIEEQHWEAVFERMYTLEDSRSRNYQGSGLGLTITKELVEKMGGEIHLDSKPFEETVFTVSFQKINY